MVVEGPFGATLTESEELTVLAASKGVQTDVGLQGRTDPLTIKPRRLLIRGTLAELLALLRQTTPSSFSRRRIPKAAISVLELNVEFRCSAMNITVIMTT